MREWTERTKRKGSDLLRWFNTDCGPTVVQESAGDFGSGSTDVVIGPFLLRFDLGSTGLECGMVGVLWTFNHIQMKMCVEIGGDRTFGVEGDSGEDPAPHPGSPLLGWFAADAGACSLPWRIDSRVACRVAGGELRSDGG